MPLFACRECGCVENTACSNYWSRTTLEGKSALCSACDPKIGKWHGKFTRRPAAGMLVDQEGHLWGQAEGMPSHSIILGVVLAAEHSKEPANV